jgi:hypothetical protein
MRSEYDSNGCIYDSNGCINEVNCKRKCEGSYISQNSFDEEFFNIKNKNDALLNIRNENTKVRELCEMILKNAEIVIRE